MSGWNRDNFFDWLDSHLREKGWTDYALAQAAGISPSVISKARNDVQPPGWNASASIAQALGLPTEIVLRKVGLLPENRSIKIDEEFVALFSTLTLEEQEEMIQIVRMKVERKKRVRN